MFVKLHSLNVQIGSQLPPSRSPVKFKLEEGARSQQQRAERDNSVHVAKKPISPIRKVVGFIVFIGAAAFSGFGVAAIGDGSRLIGAVMLVGGILCAVGVFGGFV